MKHKTNLFLRLPVAAMTASTLTLAAQAANLTWNASLPGDWNTSNTNWSGSTWNNSTPDNAIFNNLQGTVTLTQAITGGSLNYNNGGVQSGGHELTLTGSNLSVGSVLSWGGYGPLGGSVDSISQAYDQRLRIENMTLNVSGNATARRGMLYFNGATVNVGGTINCTDAWSVFRSDNSTVTATGGIDFSVIASQVELYGGTVTTPFIKVGDAAGINGTGGLYMGSGVTVVATQASSDFIQAYYNGNTGIRNVAYITTGGMTLDTAGYNVTVATALTGGGSLTKTGSGTLTLSAVNGNNSYGGGTTVSQGTLKLDLGSQSGTYSIGSFSVSSGATLTLDNTNTTAGGYYPSNFVLSGAGTVTKTGVGSIDLWTGSSLTGFTGTMDVQQGALRLNNVGTNANMGQATLNIASGATFDLRYGSSLSVDKLTGLGTFDQSFNGGSGLSVTVGSNNGSSSFGGVIQNSSGQPMSLTKTGSGTFTLGGSSSYTGATTVSAGKLLINGNNSAATGAVTVASGATLGGIGTVGGAITIQSGGHLAVGNSPGTQTFNSSLTFDSGSIFDWELNAATSDTGTSNQGTYDKVVANGNVSGTSVFTVALGTNAFTDAFWDTDKTWSDIFTGTGSFNLASIFTTFGGAGVSSSGLVTGQGQFSFTSNTLTWTAVPEPTGALAGLLIATGLLRRRRNG